MKNIITVIAIIIIPVMAYLILNNEAQKQEAMAKDNNLPTLMTFSSAMCLDCKRVKATIKEVENDYKGKINFISVNATDNNKSTKELIKQYGITLVPTMIFLDKNDNEIKKIEGAITKEELTNELEVICNG